MDSLKMFKGYGKVEDNHHLEDQQQQQQKQQQQHPKFSNPLIATLSIFTILFLTLTLALALAVLIHHTNTTESPKQQPSNSAIRAVCNVTRFPDSCFSSLSSSQQQQTTDPQSILKLSLQVSFTELTKLASSLRAMNGPALADCSDQMDDALSLLNDSMSAMEGGIELTDAKISDIQTWVSAAVTDQQTCLDGLEEMGSADAGKVKSMTQRSCEYTSNSLAIVANLRVLLEKFHVPLHWKG